jgi:predicted PurR-regulated permease PerM
MNHNRGLRTFVTVSAVATIALLVAVLIINSRSEGSTSVTTQQPTVTAPATSPPTDRLTQMEASGELHDMLQQHQAMMQQMQASATPQMLERMKSDPMWQMLSSGELIRLMEQHQQQLDSMLGVQGNGAPSG